MSHLFFADDCLLFFKIKAGTPSIVKNVLHTYESPSGQVVNYEKSELLCSKRTTLEVRTEFCNELGVHMVHSFPRYLGMPIDVSGHMFSSFAYLLDRITNVSRLGIIANCLVVGRK